MGTTLSVLAPAKVNLFLRVVGRRADGYHLLQSVMVPVGIYDEIRLTVASERPGRIDLACDNPGIPAAEHNLVHRAARLFLERTEIQAGLAIELRKRIPAGSGLGGGSSDAAATLLALDRLLGTGRTAAELAAWGLELGADVPFFIYGRPAWVEGIGEAVTPLAEWPTAALVIACPSFGLSTAEIYRGYDAARAAGAEAGASLTNLPSLTSIPKFTSGERPLRELLVNDLEPVAAEVHPELLFLKGLLMQLGAEGAVMTGSGSAMFGIWPTRAAAEVAAGKMRGQGIWAVAAETLNGSPAAG